MTEPGISRVLAASLHQAISDLLADRLEFYENWLDSDGMRHGTIGLAALNAVLSFLRREGEAYKDVVQLAGRYAAGWTVEAQGRGKRALLVASPRAVRVRAAIGAARRAVAATHPGCHATARMANGSGVFEVRGSLFCNVRQRASEPLCGFYASLLARLLELHEAGMTARIRGCKAVGDGGCVIEINEVTSAE